MTKILNVYFEDEEKAELDAALKKSKHQHWKPFLLELVRKKYKK